MKNNEFNRTYNKFKENKNNFLRPKSGKSNINDNFRTANKFNLNKNFFRSDKQLFNNFNKDEKKKNIENLFRKENKAFKLKRAAKNDFLTNNKNNKVNMPKIESHSFPKKLLEKKKSQDINNLKKASLKLNNGEFSEKKFLKSEQKGLFDNQNETGDKKPIIFFKDNSFNAKRIEFLQKNDLNDKLIIRRKSHNSLDNKIFKEEKIKVSRLQAELEEKIIENVDLNSNLEKYKKKLEELEKNIKENINNFNSSLKVIQVDKFDIIKYIKKNKYTKEPIDSILIIGEDVSDLYFQREIEYCILSSQRNESENVIKIEKNQNNDINNDKKEEYEKEITNLKNIIESLNAKLNEEKEKNLKKNEEIILNKDNGSDYNNYIDKMEELKEEKERNRKELNKIKRFLEDKEDQLDQEYELIRKQKLNYENYEKEKQNFINEINNLNSVIQNLQNQINQMKGQNNINNININLMNNNNINKNNNIHLMSNNNINLNQNNDLKRSFDFAIRKKSKPKPISLYAEPSLVGLKNIGSICFINASLQCLSQTEILTNYFLREDNRIKIFNNNINIISDENRLSPFYLELIQQLWSKNDIKSFSPEKFMNRINKLNPLFQTGNAGDAKDFIMYILEQIHRELKKSVNNNNFSLSSEPLNQYIKKSSLSHFFNDFQKETSIISDTFFGFTESTLQCMNCKKIYEMKGMNPPMTYNYDIFNCLIFPLEEVRKMKNSSMQQNNVGIMGNNNRVNIYECFYYNQNGQYFTGEDKNYCNICKSKQDTIYKPVIFISPNVLILILNRGKGNMYNVKLDFSEKIDISQFVLKKSKPKMIYDLYAVITHLGKSGPDAHFVASCKSPVNQKWYRYNDILVNPINDLQKEVIDFGNPYILFYQLDKSM